MAPVALLPLAAAGMIYYLLVFYMVALAAETVRWRKVIRDAKIPAPT